MTFDLTEVKQVSGVVLQGGGMNGDEYVTRFAVAFSMDGEAFVNVTDPSGELKVGFEFFFPKMKRSCFI